MSADQQKLFLYSLPTFSIQMSAAQSEKLFVYDATQLYFVELQVAEQQ